MLGKAPRGKAERVLRGPRRVDFCGYCHRLSLILLEHHLVSSTTSRYLQHFALCQADVLYIIVILQLYIHT